MKTFLQFITESTATQQAARLGLQSDGHGGWTDRTTGGPWRIAALCF